MSTAIQFRMGAGFQGAVNRSHPASIEPDAIDSAAPPLFYGCAVFYDAAGVRQVTSTDSSADKIDGVLVRPFPRQAPSSDLQFGGQDFAAVAPPTSGNCDIIKSGYIMVKANGATAKGGRVFVWVAASSGAHVQGGFEAAAGGGSNTIELDEKSYFNGVPDANGIVELAFNL